MTDRNCEHCGEVLIRPPRLSPKNWAKRRFCNTVCTYAAKRVDRRCTCARCGVEFMADYGKQRRRKFCSLKCSARARGNPRYRKVKAKGGSSRLEHRVVMEEKLSRPLLPHETVHHRNGRKLDNHPDNLELWVKPQPAGQRLDDLIDWVVLHYPEEVLARLAAAKGGPR